MTKEVMYPIKGKRPDGNGAHHIATKVLIGNGGNQYVQGCVKHVLGEHRMLRLSKGVWYLAVENTALASVGLGGKID